MKITVQEYGELMKKWEEEFPVNTWKVNNVHLWPILKTTIYFSLFREEKKVKKHSILGQFFIDHGKRLKNISRFLRAQAYYRSLRFSPNSFLFSGANSYRVKWEEKSFNRFFDPILDYLQNRGYNSLLLEYQYPKLNSIYKPSRVLYLNLLLPAFQYKENLEFLNDATDSAKQLNAFFSQLENKTGLEKKLMQNKIRARLKSILTWANVYEMIFKRTAAKFTFGLCYYNNAMYGMNFAAKKLGITSFDMQHGLQGPLHPAYFFTDAPSEGYNILPEYFWVWENISFKNIEKWTKNNFHKPILGGNPWIEFLSGTDKFLNSGDNSRKIILYTLQPLEPLIPNHILETIKVTSERYDWWVRLHPRMTDLEIKEVHKIFKQNKLGVKIKMEEASNLPLPYLLTNCSLHVSKSSGSIAEAAIVQTPTLIIDELGVNSYQELIETGIAYACLTNDSNQIINLIEEIISNRKDHYQVEIADKNSFEKIIDRFLSH